MAQPQQKDIVAFRRKVLAHFRMSHRSFPWRKTTNPYHILISEIMLQQTQAPRVVEFYKKFLKRFPTVRSLAVSSFADVYPLWRGLGYNRRARYLIECAKNIEVKYEGVVPKDPKLLELLPGIGEYTARAIIAFAYNEPVVFIETNIRSAFIHHFFKGVEKVGDRELLPIIEATLPKRNIREWYSALMDYGAHLKKTRTVKNSRSSRYVRQKPFKGSTRELRGKILSSLSLRSMGLAELAETLSALESTLRKAIEQLIEEGLVTGAENKFALAS